MQFVWWQKWDFKVGRHTRAICYSIDDAIEDYKNGISTYLDIEVPYRHGKSDLVSRALPAFFLGVMAAENPDIIMTGYGESLIHGFSHDTKAIIRSPEYQELFPEVKIKVGEDKVEEWKIEDSTGKVVCVPLGGQIMGKGARLLIIDDFLKSKASARSDKERDKVWEAITDAMTRLGPVHIVIFCATSWHIDDPRQRARKREKEDPDFPKFTRLSFPAKVYGEDGIWTGGYLFEEFYPPSWYRMEYSINQSWASALLDCNPLPASGNIFDVTGIQIHDDDSEFPNVAYIRCWDLASSEKERVKDDPDYTVGGLGTVTMDKFGFLHLWIKDVVWGQWEAPLRDVKIRQTAKKDGPGVHVYVEAFGAYKDAYTTLKKILHGHRIVKKSKLPGDKVAKCADEEPIFEAGHVHLVKGEWNQMFIDQHAAHPEGNHDDFCDMAAIIYHESTKPKGGIMAVP